MSDKNIKNPYHRTLKEYGASSSLHGIGYIFERNQTVHERSFWIFVVIVAVLIGTYLSFNIFRTWQDDPILITIGTTGLPVENIEFPAITICGQGLVQEVVDAALFHQFNRYLSLKNINFDDLSQEEIVQEGHSFLKDMYPGAKALPNHLVRLMASPNQNVDQMIKAESEFNTEVLSDINCLEKKHENSSKSRRKRQTSITTEQDCPEGDWWYDGFGTCLHFNPNGRKTFTEAQEYCNSLGNGIDMFQIKEEGFGYSMLWDSLRNQKVDVQCATWPSSHKYGCSLDNGDDWTVLDEAIFGTAECEFLCRQYGTDNGCCFVSNAFGCYWKGGATVTNDPGDNALAITCTVRSTSLTTTTITPTTTSTTNLVTYFLEKEGVNDCSVGEKVRDSISCEIACKNYNFPLKEMIDGLLCYRSKTGDCGADAKIGSTASLICKIDENPSSTKICRDTIGWTNGWDCRSKGYRKTQGCLQSGWICDKYSKSETSTTGHKQQAWCANNAALPGFPGQFGKANNYPENNCCICGKTEDEYQSFNDNKVVIDEGKNLVSRQSVSKKTCMGLCSGTNDCNSFVHCETEQKDVSGTKISMGDCMLKDKVLTGSEATRDDSSGNKCTTTYKKLSDECQQPLVSGAEYSITDDKITASSKWRRSDNLGNARLNKEEGRLGWVAGPDQMNQNQWIRAEFNEPFKISAIQTQGRAFKREIHFTKSYKVSYSIDGIKWNVYSDMHGSEKVFAGNSDRHTIVTNELNPPIPEARFVKILPQEWERSVTLRFEILGCRVKVCYCEHKNGITPNNGIMCGYKEGDFSINGHCTKDESCVGPTKDDPLSKRVPSFRKAELCSKSIEYVYEHTPKACVSGHNLNLFNDMSVEECKTKCNQEASCLAFEYGVPYGGSNTLFKPKDCTLQNGIDPKGCDGAHFNLDLYVKKDLDSNLYKMGSMGIKECPNGYKTINDEKTCEIASIALNLKYDASKNENNSNAICFYCSKWCRPLSTRVSSDHRNWARFICQKADVYELHIYKEKKKCKDILSKEPIVDQNHCQKQCDANPDCNFYSLGANSCRTHATCDLVFDKILINRIIYKKVAASSTATTATTIGSPAITFTKYDGKYCKNHNWFGSTVESGRYKYKTLSENVAYCKLDENCLSFYQTGCSGNKFTNCMKDGHGEASDSKYRIVPSGSGSCLYVKEIPSTTSTTPTPMTTAEATTAGASESSDLCVNTRDNGGGNIKCAGQLKSKGSCQKYLGWKDCDRACNLCACSTATGTSKEHCSGHGTCEAICTKHTCTGAKCQCDSGWSGDKCQNQKRLKHKNFHWYLSRPGDSCDQTCQINKLANGATDAAKSIDEGDCTVMKNFLEQGKTELTSKSNTSYWTFGYFYDSYSKYVCTSYGSYVSAGVGPGQTNLDSDRRVVCPCQREKVQYKGFSWYLGDPGNSCDKTCKDVSMMNVAVTASKVIKPGDCTVISNFLKYGKINLTEKSDTNSWTFGYFYNSYGKYVCTGYGSFNKIGVGPGQMNLDSDRRLVCPCYKALNTTLDLNQQFWVKASRVEDLMSNKNKQFYYDAKDTAPMRPAAAGSYIKSDATQERMTEKCMTLSGTEGSLSAKYDAKSAKCGSNVVEDTAFSICMTVDTSSTTTVATTTTVLPTTTKPLIWGPVPGKRLPKLPCIPSMRNSDLRTKRRRSLRRNKRNDSAERERPGTELTTTSTTGLRLTGNPENSAFLNSTKATLITHFTPDIENNVTSTDAATTTLFPIEATTSSFSQIESSTTSTILSTTEVTKTKDTSPMKSIKTTTSTASQRSRSDPPNIQKLKLSLDSVRKEERLKKFKELKRTFNDMYGNLDINKAYENLFEILWYSQLPCFDIQNITSESKDELSMIKRCYWKGQRVDCSSIFVARPTDRGMCCAFNAKKANNVLRESRYKSALIEMQNRDLKYTFEHDPLSDKTHNSHEPKTQPGQDKGLRLVLDAHSDRISPKSVSDNFRGFVTNVDVGDKYPMTSISSFLIRPGKENHIILSAASVDADQDIKPVKSFRRKCYFSNENHLLFHLNYSRDNCLFECNLNYSIRMMERWNNTRGGCVPWFYPSKNLSIINICDPWETRKFQSFMSHESDFECRNRCLPNCKDTIYETSISTAPFRYCDHTNLGTSPFCVLDNQEMNPSIWMHSVEKEFESNGMKIPEYLKYGPDNLSSSRKVIVNKDFVNDLTFLHQFRKSPKYDAFEKDIAIANFYFDQSSVMQYKHGIKMTTIGFISQIGGVMGLSIGLSFVSVIEILYFVLIRLSRNLNASDKNKSKRIKRKGL